MMKKKTIINISQHKLNHKITIIVVIPIVIITIIIVQKKMSSYKSLRKEKTI